MITYLYMKIRKGLFIISLGLCAVMLMAADGEYSQTNKISLVADYITSDELGYIFVVKDNQLAKYHPEGKKMYTYSNLYAGDITYVDTHDPLKILLYYEAFGRVEFLDHTLSLTTSTIELYKINLELANLVCASYQGAFWVYNPVNFELVRVNSLLEITEKTGNLQQAIGVAVEPNYMLERDNFLYVNDPATGILIFDKYGSYYKTIPVKGLSSFQVFEGRIIYFIGDEISIYDTRLNELNSTSLPWKDARSVSVSLSLKPQRLYMLSDEALFFYNIN